MKEINRATPPSLSFVATTVGSTSSDSPQTVQVVNIGNQPLTFSTPVSGTNPSYPTNFPENAIDTNLCASGAPLAQGTSCDVSMSFAPTIAGANVDSVLLTDNNLNQTNATQSIALNGTGVKVTQTITFPAITGTHDALTSYTLSATASSGLTVGFASASPTICTVSGTTASLLIPGVCVIHATQAGNAEYTAAPRVARASPSPRPRRPSPSQPSPAPDMPPPRSTLSATASSSLAVTFYRRRRLGQGLHHQRRNGHAARARHLYRASQPGRQHALLLRANSAAEHPRPPCSADNHLPGTRR